MLDQIANAFCEVGMPGFYIGLEPSQGLPWQKIYIYGDELEPFEGRFEIIHGPNGRQRYRVAERNWVEDYPDEVEVLGEFNTIKEAASVLAKQIAEKYRHADSGLLEWEATDEGIRRKHSESHGEDQQGAVCRHT